MLLLLLTAVPPMHLRDWAFGAEGLDHWLTPSGRKAIIPKGRRLQRRWDGRGDTSAGSTHTSNALLATGSAVEVLGCWLLLTYAVIVPGEAERGYRWGSSHRLASAWRPGLVRVRGSGH